MAEYEFTPPEYIEGFGSDTVQLRMMDALPPDIDDMPGGFPWDFTYPSALEFDRFANDALMRAIKNMFPQYAAGAYLDMHGRECGVERRPARHATSVLTVRGVPGTLIPAGTAFCTASVGDVPSIVYLSDVACIIGDVDAKIPVTAQEAGKVGNTMADTIMLMQTPIEGVTYISNEEPVHDGFDVENDSSYRERIIATYRLETSFVGNPADYVRWATEVSGVGYAVCIPEWNGPGTVKLVIRDLNGEPASQSIQAEVYDHIAKTPDSLDRLAPIGALLTVCTPEPLSITFDGIIYLDAGYEADKVLERIIEVLEGYLTGAAIEEGLIRWSKCFALVKDVPSVVDMEGFLLNEGCSNLTVTAEQYPRISTMRMTAREWR